MCTIFFLKRGDVYESATNKGELRALLGVEPVADGEYFARGIKWTDNGCLCPWDEKATAALVPGLKLWWEGPDLIGEITEASTA